MAADRPVSAGLGHAQIRREFDRYGSYSPGSGSLLGIEDDQAVGIVMQAGIPAGTVQARWLSPTTKNPWSSLATTPDFHGEAQTRKLSGEAWELRTNGSLQGGYFAAVALMGVLGFAVLL